MRWRELGGRGKVGEVGGMSWEREEDVGGFFAD